MLGQPYRLTRVNMLGEMRDSRGPPADGLLVGVARWFEYHEVDTIARWPRLQALRRRLDDDPAVRFALACEDGRTPAGSGALVAHVPLAEVLRHHQVS